MYAAVRKKTAGGAKTLSYFWHWLGEHSRWRGFSQGQGVGTGYLGCCSGEKSLRGSVSAPTPHPGSGPPLSYFSQRTGEERGFPANPRVEEPINFCPCQDWVSFRARCCQMPWFLRLLPHSVILYFFLSVNFILSFDRCPS